MEKLVLIINAHRPDTRVIAFACDIAKTMQTTLTGYLVENIAFTNILTEAVGNGEYFNRLQEKATTNVKMDTDQATRIFREECEKKGVVNSISFGKGDPVDQIVFESRFADLLIVDPNIGFYERVEQIPSTFLKEILRKSECPVLVAPSKFEGIDEIIFCYDGSSSAVFAIKQFTYLFPELFDRKATLLHMGKKEEGHNEENERTMSLLKAHYPHTTYKHEQGTDDELFVYLFMQQRKMVVMGAYGRSMIANFFRHSSADNLVRMIDLPIFIAHH